MNETPEVRECSRCELELPLGALICPQCQTLAYAAQLNVIAHQAQTAEKDGDFARARDLWQSSLRMLPSGTKQADWVDQKLRDLEASLAADPAPEQTKSAWARRLGPFAPILVLLVKAKSLLLALFKLKFLLSFFSFMAIYIGLFGWRFGVGFTVCILIHELGHYIDIKRRGLPAEMPIFLPGFGAFVRWQGMGVSRRTISAVSLAGPLAGWIAAAACFLAYTDTNQQIWLALAQTGAMLNVLNLIPVWTLDGGLAAYALGAAERTLLLLLALAIAIVASQPLFYLVAAGFAYRLFTRDKPARDCWPLFAYYAALLAGLGVVLNYAEPLLRGLTAAGR